MGNFAELFKAEARKDGLFGPTKFQVEYAIIQLISAVCAIVLVRSVSA